MSRADTNRAKRKDFAARWQRFIFSEFSCATNAAEVFGVGLQTALNWFEGANAPEGHIVAAAFEMFPQSSQAYLIDDAARQERRA